MTDVPAYSSDALQQSIRDIRDMLAELQWIDDSLAFIDNPSSVDPPTIAEQAQTGLHIASVPLGHRHPFTAYGAVVPNHVRDDIARTCATFERRADRWAAGVAESIQTSLEHLDHEVSEDLAQIVLGLESGAGTSLDRVVETDPGGLAPYNASFYGDAATAFNQQFYEPFTEINQRHGRHLQELGTVVALQKGILDVAQSGMMSACSAIEAALEEQLSRRQAAENQETRAEIETAAAGLSILGTVMSFGGPGGAGLGAVAGVASTLLGFAADGIPVGDVSTLRAPVRSAEDIATFWMRGIAEVVSTNHGHQKAFCAQDGTTLLTNLGLTEADGYLVPPAPALAGSSADDFHHTSSPDY